MKLTKKNILLLIFALLFLMGIFFLKEYFRKPADVSTIEPAVKTTVANIVDLYASDETKANSLFLDKTIQVAGTIAEIINQKDTMVNVLLGDTNAQHKVSCLLDKRHLKNIKNYTAGRQIIIKGICTGFLMDVELNRCVIVDNNKK